MCADAGDKGQESQQDGCWDEPRSFRSFATLVQHSSEFVGVCDLQRYPIYVNPAGLEMVGLDSIAAAAGHLFEEFLFPEDREHFIGDFFDSVLAEGSSDIEIRYKHFQTGEPIWVHCCCFVILDSEGQPESVGTMSSNITQQKRDAMSARASREQLQQLADALPVMIASVDSKKCYRWLNAKHDDYFPGTAASMAGQHIRDVVGVENYRSFVGYLDEALSGHEVEFETQFQELRTGQVRTVRVIYIPQRTASDVVDGFFALATDITDRKVLDEELRQALADLSELNHRKDQFLATLAHKLRNPLAPLRTGLALLSQNPSESRRTEILDTMERQLSHVVRLVNDLLDVARISRGKVELQCESFDLREVIRAAAASAQHAISASAHSLCLDLTDSPAYMHADRARLTQVFSNLIDNAAKYTPPRGRITVAMIQHPPTDGQEAGTVEVTVADNGQGITARNLSEIFDLFTQIAETSDAQSAGLGLGLTMVRSFVEMHEGTVRAESEGPGLGTTFRVRLPIAEPVLAVHDEATDPYSSSDDAVRRLRVLIIDDNVAATNLLGELVESLGHEVATAYNGGEALTEADRVRPELVIMDIGMPIMNGYEAARAMRRRDWAKDATLIALTGYGQDADRQGASDAGFDRHIVKPIEPEEVERLVRDTAGRITQTSQANPPGETES